MELKDINNEIETTAVLVANTEEFKKSAVEYLKEAKTILGDTRSTKKFENILDEDVMSHYVSLSLYNQRFCFVPGYSVHYSKSDYDKINNSLSEEAQVRINKFREIERESEQRELKIFNDKILKKLF